MYITKNDLKAIYILPLDSSKGRLHINYKYTLLAIDAEGVLAFLKLDGAKETKTSNKPYIYYNHTSGGMNLTQEVTYKLKAAGVKVSTYLQPGSGVPLYTLSDTIFELSKGR